MAKWLFIGSCAVTALYFAVTVTLNRKGHNVELFPSWGVAGIFVFGLAWAVGL